MPIIICLIFTIISTIIGTKFKDIYVNKLKQNEISNKVKEYRQDFKISIKNIMCSKRLRALLIFMGLFNSCVTIMSTFKGNILTELRVPPETFSIINAVLTFISGIAATFQNKFHKKFRNKTFAVLSLAFSTSIIMIGVILASKANNILPIILILFAVRSITMSNYYVLSERYSKNFTTPKTRARISFAAEFSTNIIESILLFLTGILLDGTNITFATLFVGLTSFVLFILALDYMRTRVGLKPEQYSKQDIELE